MTSSPSGQTRTPPHLKWLLNERAMLCGEVSRREREIRALLTERAAMRTRIRSLDQTMAMFAPELDPTAAGTVHAITGRYEKHGGLTAFIRAQLDSSGSPGLDTVTLLERAAVRFGIDMSPPGARKRFKDTLLWTLRNLERNQLAEVAVDSRGGRRPKTWRTAQTARFQDLLRQQQVLDA